MHIILSCGSKSTLHSLPYANIWPPFGLVVKAFTSRAKDPGFKSCLHRDFSRVESFQWLKKYVLQWWPCQAPGITGSLLGLVGPVSVYCDWVRWKVWSALLSVAAHKIVWADPSLRYTSMQGCRLAWALGKSPKIAQNGQKVGRTFGPLGRTFYWRNGTSLSVLMIFQRK